jgi:hypothetical protein
MRKVELYSLESRCHPTLILELLKRFSVRCKIDRSTRPCGTEPELPPPRMILRSSASCSGVACCCGRLGPGAVAVCDVLALRRDTFSFKNDVSSEHLPSLIFIHHVPNRHIPWSFQVPIEMSNKFFITTVGGIL